MSSADPNAPFGPSSFPAPSQGLVATESQLSFESVLGWFGRFTPQFKFKLLMMRKRAPLAEFEARMRDIFETYRIVLIALARVPKGAERARAVYAILDEELAAMDRTEVTCGKGCAACCRSFPKQVTDDEAAALAALVHSGEVEIDRAELTAQARELRVAAWAAAGAGMPCPFLGSGGECRVYADRPSVCRKTYVVSDPAECGKDGGAVAPKVDVMPELIVSAAMSLPETRVGWLSTLVLEELEKRETAVSEAGFNFPRGLEIVEE